MTDTLLERVELIRRIKYVERNKIDFYYTYQLRVEREENLKKIDLIVSEIIDELCRHSVYRDASKHVIIDGYYIPDKYINVLNEIQLGLIKWFQSNGLPRSYVSFRGTEIIIYPTT